MADSWTRVGSNAIWLAQETRNYIWVMKKLSRALHMKSWEINDSWDRRQRFARLLKLDCEKSNSLECTQKEHRKRSNLAATYNQSSENGFISYLRNLPHNIVQNETESWRGLPTIKRLHNILFWANAFFITCRGHEIKVESVIQKSSDKKEFHLPKSFWQRKSCETR